MKSNSGGVNFSWLASFTFGGILILNVNQVLAQVTPDNTLGDESSVVNPRDENSDSIDGGALRGSNLFHSFQEFNVGENRGVYFANPDAVNNIFSRVTGSNVSNILGTLGVDGAANLYLINSNGIVFGENASLDVQGSFTATTAEGIEFGEGGLFSAVEPGESLLTISVPLGLQFGSTPGSIVNRSSVQDSAEEFVGLEVNQRNSLALIGGDINFEGGVVTASGGNIYFGGLAEAGIVDLNQDGSLVFPKDLTKANVTLTNLASVDATGTGGGNIAINAQNLILGTGEEFDINLIQAGITDDSSFETTQAGNIAINAAEKVIVNNGFINNTVDSDGIGNAGNITINTDSLELTNGSQISAFTVGKGDSSSININANSTVSVDSESAIASQVVDTAIGNSGGVNITTTDLILTNGGEVNAITFGEGDAGAININASGTINLENFGSIDSTVEESAIGNSGGIKITTTDLNLIKVSSIDASTSGQGDAGIVSINASGTINLENFSSIDSTVEEFATGNSGGINITTTDLNLVESGGISSDTFGQGNAGVIAINTSGTINLENGFITSVVEEFATGNSGDINIMANNLSLSQGSLMVAFSAGQGNSGDINIIMANDISLSDSFISSPTFGIGNAGAINITTTDLTLTQGGRVNASTLGEGDAGAVTINASGTISINNEVSNSLGSGIFSQVDDTAIGNSGGVNITTTDLTLTQGGVIDASTFGKGNAGGLEINANNLNLDENAFIISSSETSFDAGDITLEITNSLQATDSEISTLSLQSSGGNLIVTAGDIELRGNSNITTNIFSGKGSGGNINITADSVIAFDDSDIFASAPEGQGGNITLDTPAFFAENFTFNSLTVTNPVLLENNSRADVNATGAVSSGAVSIPDVSFIQNSLTELPDNSLNTDELVANSCVVPAGERNQGKFIITGAESLPVRPGGNLPSKYPTGEVRGVSEDTISSWQPGDPIVEPQGVYRLANGKLVMSRECTNLP